MNFVKNCKHVQESNIFTMICQANFKLSRRNIEGEAVCIVSEFSTNFFFFELLDRDGLTSVGPG